MSQKTLMWKWVLENSAAALLIVAVGTGLSANAADDTPNHPLIDTSTGAVNTMAGPDEVRASWDDVRPPPPTSRTSAIAMETEALTAVDEDVRVWTDDFRPPPKGF